MPPMRSDPELDALFEQLEQAPDDAQRRLGRAGDLGSVGPIAARRQ